MTNLLSYKIILSLIFGLAFISPKVLADGEALTRAGIHYVQGSATRSEVIATRIFAKPFTATGPTSSLEDAALGDALIAYVNLAHPTDYTALETFLNDYPNTKYGAFIRLQIARSFYQQGRYSRSLDYYAAAWSDLAVEIQDPLIEQMSGEVAAGYARMLSRVGRTTELETFLTSVESRRSWIGAAREQVDQARVGLWLMHQRPGRSFRCGSLALSNVARLNDLPSSTISQFQDADSPGIGFSLLELESLSANANWPQRAVAITAEAQVPVPSVVHWKIGHYAAIIGKRGNTYLLRDPTFGENRDVVMSEAALREESSGFFLIGADADMKTGWRLANEVEKNTTRGKGQTYGNNAAATRASDHVSQSCGNGAGMAVATVKSMLVSLHLRDIPLFYRAPYGPEMDFTLHYNQREANTFYDSFANFGPRWAFNWIGWINEEGGGLPPAGPEDYPMSFTLAAPLGGEVAYQPMDGSGSDFIGEYDASRAVRQAPGQYVITYADGSRHEYMHPVGNASERPVLLTRVIDPMGNAVEIGYDSENRITSITDAAGGATTVDYHPTLTRRITHLTLPDGRRADFNYTTDGCLAEIRDTQGITSVFTYGETGYPDRVTALNTPYGETRFRFGESSLFYTPPFSQVERYRWIELIDPDGSRSRVEFNESENTGIPYEEQWQMGLQPNMPIRNSVLYSRNTFFWSKSAFKAAPSLTQSSPEVSLEPSALTPADYAKSEVFHWLHTADMLSAQDTIESYQRAGEGRVWFNYPGQDLSYGLIINSAGDVIGDDNTNYSDAFVVAPLAMYSTTVTRLGNPPIRQPSRVGRVVPDPSGAVDAQGNPALVSQVSSFGYNELGLLVRERDPDGREHRYYYATNGIDLERIERLVARTPGNEDPNSWTWEVLMQIDWNSGVPHRPHSVTDVALQTITYTYNSVGQVRTITNSRNETTTYWYHPTGQNVTPTTSLSATATGYLVRIDGPLSGDADALNFTWDTSGRIYTTTNRDGYTLIYNYDNLDRVKKITYPDTTFEEYDYGNKLDLEMVKDRAGRLTSYEYDELRRLRYLVDSANKISEWTWCGCGSLERFIDPAGRSVHFDYDINGRLNKVSRMRANPLDDPDIFQYFYDLAGRLKRRVDARGQITNYRYTKSDGLLAIVHENAVESTPDTFFEYDPMRPRLVAIENKIGGSSAGRVEYGYHPITTLTGTLGAGRVASISSPSANSMIGFLYDELGRVTQRNLPGQTETWQYDALGRLSSHVNPLGTFTPGYEGASDRLNNLAGNNGLTTVLNYDPIVSDLGLTNLEVRNTSGSPMAVFAYTNDHIRGLPTQVVENRGGSSISTWRYTYTSTDELEAAWRTDTGTALALPTDYSYVYDGSGNRQGSQAGTNVVRWNYNDRNQATGQEAGGWARFMFKFPITPAGGKAVISGLATTVDIVGEAHRMLAVEAGNNDVTVSAVVPNEGAVVRRKARLTVEASDPLTFEHDANGNLTTVKRGGTIERFYRYDARDRMVAWGTGSVIEGRFVYDPLGRISQETTANGAIVNSFVWSGSELLQKRSASNTVDRRYFAQGEKRESGTDPGNRYYARDRQGSLQLVFNSLNQLVSTYAYDPSGKRVQTSGTESHDFGYQGAYVHESTALLLGADGMYDPQTSRWLTPLADEIPGYAFGGNAPPATGDDPSGLMATGAYPPSQDDELIGASGVAHMLGATAAGVIADYQRRQREKEPNQSSGSCAIGNRAPTGKSGGAGPGRGTTQANSDIRLALPYDASVVSYQAGKIRSFVTEVDEIYYRVFSGSNTAGSFITKVKPRSADWATEALALPPGNRADFIQEVLVPAGTRLQRSRAAGNAWGRGGAEQFEILKIRPGEYQPVQFGQGTPFR